MKEKKQIACFSNDLDALVERYRNEWNISYASVVGSLYMKAHLLCVEAENQEHDEPPEEN